jgi:RNA polymerase sigma-70 factor (ECF subfamily)
MKFKHLYTSFYPLIVAFCYKYLSDIDKAQNIAQDCFVKLYSKDYDLKNNDKVKSYLYSTAKNLCLNEIRNEKIRSKHYEYSHIFKEEFYISEILTTEIYEDLRIAINKLPSQNKKIINLILKDYGNKEIAEELGISPHTVKNIKRTALNKLKDYLKDLYSILLTI